MTASPKTCSAWLSEAMHALGDIGVKSDEIRSITCYRASPTVAVSIDTLQRACAGRQAEVSPHIDGDHYVVRLDSLTLVADVPLAPRDWLPRKVQLEQPSVAHSPNELQM